MAPILILAKPIVKKVILSNTARAAVKDVLLIASTGLTITNLIIGMDRISEKHNKTQR